MMKIGKMIGNWLNISTPPIAKEATSSICGTQTIKEHAFILSMTRCYKDLIYILMMHLFLTCDNGVEYPGISVIAKFCCNVFCLVSEV